MTDTSTVHLCPVGTNVTTICCSRTLFELPRDDRVTNNADQVTCKKNDKWPSDKLEREMLADVRMVEENANEHSAAADMCCHVKALLARVRELESRLDNAIAMTDTGSEEFRKAFPTLSAGGHYFPRDNVPGWRVVEAIREALTER